MIHEIDVHAQRSINGAKQPLRIFQTGLPQSILTEEGLAMLEVANCICQNTLADQTHIVWAIDQARYLGFENPTSNSSYVLDRVCRGLYALPNETSTSGTTGRICKRQCLSQRIYSRANGYAAEETSAILRSVDISHPIEEWLKQGWITLQSCPFFWTEPHPS